jgi:hypothetical protein
MRDGKLATFKIGRRRLVTAEGEAAYLATYRQARAA